MALSVNDVMLLREKIAAALSSGQLNGFDSQFLSGHAARLEQHGTHAMMTVDQRSRIDAILAKANGAGGEGQPA